ncbi:MAG TPA: cytochrome c [Candidatus Melainabacteria bacterium]|nr:cytochrome c [Candidatus Melainabacteria bacterium]HMP53671.1 cytochrome c [Candidatus Melainabacteria bacterium]
MPMLRIAFCLAGLTLVSATTGGCVMSEEMKRIEQVKLDKLRKSEEMTSNLSGKQIFVRSCNTCHPGGAAGMGPSLDQLKDHFPTDDKLKAFIRQGAGAMPPQPLEVLNDKEMDNLVDYLRHMEVERN